MSGALMIVLWNVLVLHARWGGLVRERGLANLAVFGNAVVTWSWFGTNQLGVGLHAYGFTQGITLLIIGIVLGNLLIIIVGSIPERMWASSPIKSGVDAKGR